MSAPVTGNVIIVYLYNENAFRRRVDGRNFADYRQPRRWPPDPESACGPGVSGAGHGQALANGGRYNGVGEVFGRARPATGFATDLKALMGLLPADGAGQGVISMPDSDDPELLVKVDELRQAGEIVINSLGGERDGRCDRELVEEDGAWEIKPL